MFRLLFMFRYILCCETLTSLELSAELKWASDPNLDESIPELINQYIKSDKLYN